MFTRKIFFFTALFLIACLPLIPIQNINAESLNLTDGQQAEFAETIIDELQEEIQASFDKGNCSGAAIVVVNARDILWLQTYGFTDTTESKNVNDETIFSLQSVTKNFTALAVLTAIRDGLLDLDTPIKKYIPGFTVNSKFDKYPETKITLRHLLSHTAGFPHEAPLGSNYDFRPHKFEEHIESITQTWLKLPVGYHRSYSNLGVDLAGYILQVVSGLSYEQYVTEKLLLPLGMDKSTFSTDEILKNDNRAVGYKPEWNSLPVQLAMIPAGGLYTNIKEMANYLRFHLNHGVFNDKRLLDENLLNEMYAPAFPWMGQTCGYGLGIAKDKAGATYCLHHAGGGFGFSSGFVFYPELNLGVAILANSGKNRPGLNLIREIIGIESLVEFGQPAAEDFYYKQSELTGLSHDDPRLRKILGRYGSSRPWIFEYQDSTLFITVGQQSYPVTAFIKDDQIVGKFAVNTEFSFLYDLPDKPGALITNDRFYSACVYHDYNDGPNDPPGPDKKEWDEYLGDYYIIHAGQEAGPFTVAKKNGYLYCHNQRCIEYETGLFYCFDGDVLDFRDNPVTWGNIRLQKK